MGTRNIASRKCAIYGNDIPRMAAMMLAKQHNKFNSIQCSTGFAELAACCESYIRAFCYGQMTVKLTYPGRDITKKIYIAFQQECLALLTTSQIVRSFFLLCLIICCI